MRVLSLDLSSSTGWAVFKKDSEIVLESYGLLQLDKKVKEYGIYPYSVLYAAQKMCDLVQAKILETQPDIIVVEEINSARQRIVQKFLDGVHILILRDLPEYYRDKIHFISSSEWRKVCGALLTKEDKRSNAKLSRAKSDAKKKKEKLDKKKLGIRGKFTKKHAAIRFCNEKFRLDFSAGMDDIADALCLNWAYLNGAKLCDGK